MPPQPLGPDSVTWKYFGDWRNVLVVLWVGSMQNMHPGLAVGVEQNSAFLGERWQRVLRSFYPILGVVYDGASASETAVKVRAYHNDISGVDAAGHRHHALSPEIFYWAHAVFFMTMIRFGNRFLGGVSELERRRLFEEHVQWYRLYGLSMRVVPASWADFQEYWRQTCLSVLEDTQATRDVLDLTGVPKPSFLWWLPEVLWRPLRAMGAKIFLWLTVGLYDPEVRDRLGLRWTDPDERWHRRAGWLVNRIFRLLPHDRRFHPRARAGWRRSRGEVEPLVESPARYF